MNNIKNAETYAFLNLQAILEEEHVWCDAILTEVKETDNAIWIHGLTSEKLKLSVYRKTFLIRSCRVSHLILQFST